MGYRIAGVEDGYEITASDMDGATLKLYAIAEVVGRLMKKKSAAVPVERRGRELAWSSEMPSGGGTITGQLRPSIIMIVTDRPTRTVVWNKAGTREN